MPMNDSQEKPLTDIAAQAMDSMIDEFGEALVDDLKSPISEQRKEAKSVEPVVAEPPSEEMLQDFGRFVVAILGERNRAELAERWKDSLRRYREAMAVVSTSVANGEHDAQQQAARDAAAAAAEQFGQVDGEVQQVLKDEPV